MNSTSREKVVDLKLGRTLKTLGFNYPTDTYQVNADNGAIVKHDRYFAHNLNPDRVALPSYALVIQWLAEEKNIDVVVLPHWQEEGREYNNIIYTPDDPDGLEGNEYFADRDDAMLAGIIEALEFVW